MTKNDKTLKEIVKEIESELDGLFNDPENFVAREPSYGDGSAHITITLDEDVP